MTQKLDLNTQDPFAKIFSFMKHCVLTISIFSLCLTAGLPSHLCYSEPDLQFSGTCSNVIKNLSSISWQNDSNFS